MIDESFNFLRSSTQHLSTNVVVRGIPIRDGNRRIIYRYGVRGDLVPDDFVEDLRDILARAQSVLDIAMTQAVTDAANPPLTDKQRRNTYFPIAVTESAWKSMLGQAHIKALPQAMIRSLRAIQPFVTGDAVISLFHRVHNADKHEAPLELAVIPDPEFVMMFTEIEPRTSEHWIDWVDPLPAIVNRAEFAYYRCVDPITKFGIEAIPLGLVIRVDDEWRDIQHLLWDVMEFVTRAAAILSRTSLTPANLMRNMFTAERAQLDAFKSMMLEASRTGSQTAPHSARRWQQRAEATRTAARRFADWNGSWPPGHDRPRDP
ncbi:hypothetical protein GCM10007198_19140 [Microbacterium aerolatum]|uniref:Uncharacterized protein n=2 Tax=Microbacterium aerolatum TaxID=153731 RepID=A0A511AEX0_9MICO|nr:hypothetical protein MAE01_03670 [Microbacterium aerolatum]GGB28819.1 hypothetical protein GCM10007198_19140 [Microbacterium aerolatum]